MLINNIIIIVIIGTIQSNIVIINLIENKAKIIMKINNHHLLHNIKLKNKLLKGLFQINRL